MPALQVRDLPQDLYDGLHDLAEHEHRSMAQETVVAIEKHLRLVPSAPTSQLPLTEKEERQLRIKKRKELFDSIHAMPKVKIPDDFPNVVELIQEGRESR